MNGNLLDINIVIALFGKDANGAQKVVDLSTVDGLAVERCELSL